MNMAWNKMIAIVCFGVILCGPFWPLSAVPERILYVDGTTANSGNGSAASPYKTVQEGIQNATAGTTVIVSDGVYNESLSTVHSGLSDSARVVIRAENPRGVVVTHPGRVLKVDKAFVTFDGIVFDGQMGTNDLVSVRTSGDNLLMYNCEMRNTRRDGMDMGSNTKSVSGITPDYDYLWNVVIDRCKVDHALATDSSGKRVDAHGIVAGAVRGLVIRHTEISYVSGDALQLQDGAWNDVLVENVHFWNGPLPQAAAGVSAGFSPGEDGIDTKREFGDPHIPGDPSHGKLVVRNSVFRGWDGDDLAPNTNWAGLNLKEKVQVVVHGNTFYENRHALRLRGRSNDGGAHVTVMNNVFYDNKATAVRYEDNIRNLHIYNNTFGPHPKLFQSAGGADQSTFEVLNNLFLGSSKPAEAQDSSNLATTAASFVSAAAHNYRLVEGAAPIDAGVSVGAVDADFDDTPRPQGGTFDVGAFEFVTEGGGGKTAPSAPKNFHIRIDPF
jgi:hypothetical protein